jgi:hypothetical protein
MLVWDNEAGVGKGRLTSEFAAFAGLLAVKVHLCRPLTGDIVSMSRQIKE